MKQRYSDESLIDDVGVEEKGGDREAESSDRSPKVLPENDEKTESSTADTTESSNNDTHHLVEAKYEMKLAREAAAAEDTTTTNEETETVNDYHHHHHLVEMKTQMKLREEAEDTEATKSRQTRMKPPRQSLSVIKQPPVKAAFAAGEEFEAWESLQHRLVERKSQVGGNKVTHESGEELQQQCTNNNSQPMFGTI